MEAWGAFFFALAAPAALVLALYLSVALVGRWLAAAARSAHRPPSFRGGREFTDMTPRALLALYEGRTTVQGEQLMERYKRLWIETEGEIVHILLEARGSAVVLQRGTDRIACAFEPNWNRQLEDLRPKQSLRVRGRIATRQERWQLCLSDCELV